MQNIYLNYPTEAVYRKITSISDVDMLDIRMYEGKTLEAISVPRSRFVTFNWYYGTCLSQFETTPFNTASTYQLKSSDMEKFMRVVATDQYGNTAQKDFFCSKFPVVYIYTDGGQEITSKEESVRAKLVIQGNQDYDNQYNGKIDIHLRGNSSQDFTTQKPYKIKLDQSTNLFGFGRNKHWVLLSNFLDSTMLRNKLASEIAQNAGIIGMDMIQVTVVLNGINVGVYTFGEHIRIDQNRVNIYNWEDESERRGHSSEDLSWIDSDGSISADGGYLLELDSDLDEVSQFITSGGLRVKVNRPQYAVTSDKLFGNISADMELLEGMYNADDGRYLSNLIDIDSAAKYVLHNMILANEDFSNRSRYCYKDLNGKIYFSPVWDFDISQSGVTTVTPSNSWQGILIPSSSNDFAVRLLTFDWFRKKVYDMYNSQFASQLESLTSNLLSRLNANDSQGTMNSNCRRTNTYTPSWDPGKTYTLRDYYSDKYYLYNFFNDRYRWLRDTVFVSENSFTSTVQSYISQVSKVKNKCIVKNDVTYEFRTNFSYNRNKTVKNLVVFNISQFASNCFSGCDQLSSITFVNNITSLDDYSFEEDYDLKEIDFSYNTSVPTLGYAVFWNFDYKVYVPANLESQWKQAPGWSDIASHIYVR